MADEEAPDDKPGSNSGSMTNERLKALIARELSIASSDRASASRRNARALRFYQGDVIKDLPSFKGRSQLVSTDLSDNVGWIMPQIMRLFTSAVNFVDVSPVGVEDEKWSRDATLLLNHVFMVENEGYRILHNATWDSLVMGNGVVKTWFDPTPVYEVTYHTGLSQEEYDDLVVADEELDEPDDPDAINVSKEDQIEVLAKSKRKEKQVTIDEQTGQEVEQTVTVWDCRIRRLTRKGRNRIIVIPPEDYVKNRSAKTCQEAIFQAHREIKTRSDLILMGFDRDKVEMLARDSDTDDGSSERLARDEDDTDSDWSGREVQLYEVFYKVDIDDDGIAETVRAYYAGDEGGNGVLLDWDEWEDETPFNDIPCEPIPHKWEARSLADESIDVMSAKTALLRGAMDNLYKINNPQKFVKGQLLNPDVLFSPGFGTTIFGETNSSIEEFTPSYIGDKMMSGLEYWDRVTQRRTGIGQQGVALDTDALQKQTATASQIEHDSGFSQVEMIARNHAELGWKPVLRKLLRLEIKHRNQPVTLRLHNKPVTVDPKVWNSDLDIRINTGLGTGSRDRDVAMMQIVLNNQFTMADKLTAVGMVTQALNLLPYMSRAIIALNEATGLRNPDSYMPDITTEDVQQLQQQLQSQKDQPSEPMKIEQMKAQAFQQIEQAKLQADQQKFAAQAQLDQQKQAAQIQIEQQKTAAEAQIEMEKLRARAQTDHLMEEAKMQAQVVKNQAELEGDTATKEMEKAIRMEELASKERIAFAQMTNNREIEMMKLGALSPDDMTALNGAAQDPANRRPTPTEVLIQQLIEMTTMLGQAHLMPKKIVVDPYTGEKGVTVDPHFGTDRSQVQ
jgi:hypothetical protein